MGDGMNDKQKVNKNAGFSMIELIVVITIMALMVGGSFVGIGMLALGDSKKAVKNISSQLEELRTNTLSVAGSWRAEIYKKDNSYRIDIIKKKKDLSEELVSSTAIGSKITILYKDSESSEKEVNDNNRLVISFLQGSGKVDQVKLINADLSETNLFGTSSTTSKTGDIIVKVKSSTVSNSLTLWYLTGKLTADY